MNWTMKHKNLTWRHLCFTFQCDCNLDLTETTLYSSFDETVAIVGILPLFYWPIVASCHPKMLPIIHLDTSHSTLCYIIMGVRLKKGLLVEVEVYVQPNILQPPVILLHFQLQPLIFIQLCDSFDNFPCSHDAVIDSRVRLTPSLIYPHDWDIHDLFQSSNFNPCRYHFLKVDKLPARHSKLEHCQQWTEAYMHFLHWPRILQG